MKTVTSLGFNLLVWMMKKIHHQQLPHVTFRFWRFVSDQSRILIILNTITPCVGKCSVNWKLNFFHLNRLSDSGSPTEVRGQRSGVAGCVRGSSWF